MAKDKWLDDVVLVDQLPSDSWIEGLAIRPNGHGLLSRLDQPELWTVDLNDLRAEPRLLQTFDDASGIIDIGPLLGVEDGYVVVSGQVDTDKGIFLNFAIWRMLFDPNDSSPPSITKMPTPPGAGLVIGTTPLTDRIILLADSAKGCVWWQDIETGRAAVLVEDETMKTDSEEEFFGLSRLRVSGGFLWFTNKSTGLLCKVPIKVNQDDPDAPVRTSGPIEQVVDGIPNCGGLVISEAEKHAYTVDNFSGTLWRVDIDTETGKGTTQSIMDQLVSPTSVELHTAGGKRKLYVVCGGVNEEAWINEEGPSWGVIREINANAAVSVTVNEEIA